MESAEKMLRELKSDIIGDSDVAGDAARLGTRGFSGRMKAKNRRNNMVEKRLK